MSALAEVELIGGWKDGETRHLPVPCNELEIEQYLSSDEAGVHTVKYLYIRDPDDSKRFVYRRETRS